MHSRGGHIEPKEPGLGGYEPAWLLGLPARLPEGAGGGDEPYLTFGQLRAVPVAGERLGKPCGKGKDTARTVGRHPFYLQINNYKDRGVKGRGVADLPEPRGRAQRQQAASSQGRAGGGDGDGGGDMAGGGRAGLGRAGPPPLWARAEPPPPGG